MEKRTELDVSEEFRSVIRSAAAEATLPINQYLIKVFDFVPTDKTGKKVLKFDSFERGIRSISKKFNKNHLEDIFDEVDEKGKGVISVEELVDFSQRTLSRPRTLALKLRKEIVTHYGGVSEYKIAFNSVSQNSKYIEKRNFRDFVEEMLDTNLSDNESDFIYGIYDTDGDGKISLEDFLGFLEMQAPDAVKAIDPGNPETILDIKVTNSVAQDMELSNEGYTQVLPLANGNKQVGTFGRSQSMWIWRRKQGTCGGKLKPVIDVQLEDFSYSSAMVASGYICLPLSISGQYVWIKRAKNKEEEKDALVDLAVTVGKMKVSADKIHTSPNPGMGWVKVAGNFSRGILSSFDSFLWYIPARTRTIDMMSPTRLVCI
jgi:Ca2+-binding EF-hand superfamily protein